MNKKDKPFDPSEPLKIPQHDNICKHKAGGMTGLDAYKTQYPDASYNTACSNAWKVLSTPEAQARMKYLLNEKAQLTDENTIIKLGKLTEATEPVYHGDKLLTNKPAHNVRLASLTKVMELKGWLKSNNDYSTNIDNRSVSTYNNLLSTNEDILSIKDTLLKSIENSNIRSKGILNRGIDNELRSSYKDKV